MCTVNTVDFGPFLKKMVVDSFFISERINPSTEVTRRRNLLKKKNVCVVNRNSNIERANKTSSGLNKHSHLHIMK